VFSGRTEIVYVADGTNDSPTSPSRRTRATEAGKDVLRRPFLAVYMLLLIAGCSEGPQRAPVEASPEDTPTSEARTPGEARGPCPRQHLRRPGRGRLRLHLWAGDRQPGRRRRGTATRSQAGRPLRRHLGLGRRGAAGGIYCLGRHLNDGRIDTFLLDDGSRQVGPWITTPDPGSPLPIHLPRGAQPLLVADEAHLRLVTLKGSSPSPIRSGRTVAGSASRRTGDWSRTRARICPYRRCRTLASSRRRVARSRSSQTRQGATHTGSWATRSRRGASACLRQSEAATR
jgi:hypothetical protein